jgi:hypothetical protein
LLSSGYITVTLEFTDFPFLCLCNSNPLSDGWSCSFCELVAWSGEADLRLPICFRTLVSRRLFLWPLWCSWQRERRSSWI